MNSYFETIGIILSILVMDAALSADNSLAINALALHVSKEIRSQVIWAGMVGAAVLRLVALAFAAWIVRHPWVQILAGCYLCYLVIGHFFGAEEEETENSKTQNAPSTFWSVLLSIAILDLSLSTENVIAVVAMSPNFYIVTAGVLTSIFILAVGSQVVRMVMEKIPSLEDASYLILLFLALTMFAAHSAETLVWLGDLFHISNIVDHKPIVLSYTYHISDLMEIACIGLILVGAFLKDLILKSKPSNPHLKSTSGVKQNQI